MEAGRRTTEGNEVKEDGEMMERKRDADSPHSI